jgi:amino acid transporter
VATLIVSVLLELSLILVIETIFPSLNASTLVLVLSSVVGVAVVVASVFILRSRSQVLSMSHSEKENWRMPALALLQHPKWSLGRRVAILTLRGYLVVAVVLLVVKAVQLAIHH